MVADLAVSGWQDGASCNQRGRSRIAQLRSFVYIYIRSSKNADVAENPAVEHNISVPTHFPESFDMWMAAIGIIGLLASTTGHAKSLPQSAVPVGGPGSWDSKVDYPSRALRDQAGGTTSVRLTIGIDGRVSDCEIIVSSGRGDLDQGTCGAAFKRGVFTPAKDKNGKAIVGTYEHSREWKPWRPQVQDGLWPIYSSLPSLNE